MWDHEKVDRLKNLVGTGRPIKEIAAELGLGVGVVATKIRTLRTVVRERVEEERERDPAIYVEVRSQPGRWLIEDLAHNQCRWPTSGDKEPRHLFCGERTPLGSKYPWCECHARMVYIKPRPPRV